MPSHPDPHEPTKSGDLVLLDYELWADVAGKLELIDTTREEIAQTAKITTPEGHKFGPHAHLIGGEYFPGGIENALVGAKVGTEWEKEFPPADAFGERDPKLIELYSMHEISRLPEMRRDDAHLDLGTVLTIEGRRGRVVTLTAARVRVDFNPPFAGRKITAKFKLLERIHDPAAQAKAIVDLTYGRGDEFKVEIHGDVITLHVPDRSKFDFAWAAAKPRVIDQIRSQLKPKSIHIVEEYVTPTAKETAKAESAAEKKAEASATKAEDEAAKVEAAPHSHPAKAEGDAGKPEAAAHSHAAKSGAKAEDDAEKPEATAHSHTSKAGAKPKDA
jgi:FKBP-type peptidyl-prolyl cis-trans isomerase SlyD